MSEPEASHVAFKYAMPPFSFALFITWNFLEIRLYECKNSKKGRASKCQGYILRKSLALLVACRLRHFGYRFEYRYTLRFDESPSEGQTRTDV